jgi:hypothetical protein
LPIRKVKRNVPGFTCDAAPGRLELVRDCLQAVVREQLQASHLLVVVSRGFVEDALEASEREVVDGDAGV